MLIAGTNLGGGSAAQPPKYLLKIVPSVMDIISAKFEIYISKTNEVQSFHKIAPSAPQGDRTPKIFVAVFELDPSRLLGKI